MTPNPYAPPIAPVADIPAQAPGAAAPAVGPEGIGGWLLLVLLSLIVTPIRVTFFVVTNHWHIYSSGTWAELTTPGTAAYHALWGPLLVFEVVGNVGVIVLALVTLVHLLRKSRRTPKLAIAWLAWSVAFIVADYVLAELIPAVAANPDGSGAKEVVRSLVAAGIWIPYFLVSKRVKATFVR